MKNILMTCVMISLQFLKINLSHTCGTIWTFDLKKNQKQNRFRNPRHIAAKHRLSTLCHDLRSALDQTQLAKTN